METSADTPKFHTWITLWTAKINQLNRAELQSDRHGVDRKSCQSKYFRAESSWSEISGLLLRGSNHILTSPEKCHTLLMIDIAISWKLYKKGAFWSCMILSLLYFTHFRNFSTSESWVMKDYELPKAAYQALLRTQRLEHMKKKRKEKQEVRDSNRKHLCGAIKTN